MPPLNLTQLESKITRALSHAVERLVDEAVEEAKAFAPSETGNLRRSIKKVPHGEGHFSVVAEADYADEVEFGTADTQPQPFMRPAKAWLQTGFLREIAQEMKQTLGAK